MNGYNRPPNRPTNGGNRTYTNANGTSPTQRRTPQNPNARRKKKIYFRPNKEGMTALAILVLIIAVVIILLVLTIKAIAGAIAGPEETTTVETTTVETTAPPVVAKWYDGYLTEITSSSNVSVGDLILVNFKNSYPNTDTVKLTGLYKRFGYGETFVLNNSSLKVHPDIAPSLQSMLKDLVTANPETLGGDDIVIITSGHRTVDYQTLRYNEALGTEDEGLLAVPGHSEHHTGYAVDLKIFDENNMTIPMRDNEQEWMESNCMNYGFVVRYDGAKADITGILDETWHYRYVGIPHATYMTLHDLCLEEYLELIRTAHSLDGDGPLTFTVGEDDYMVYYAPCSTDSVTEIPVPPTADGEWEISGDNMNGFIVTVKLAKKASAE